MNKKNNKFENAGAAFGKAAKGTQNKLKKEQKKQGSGQKRGSANRGTKKTGGGNAFGGAYGYGNGGGLASRGTTVGSFSGFGGAQSRTGKSGTSKSGTVSGFTAKSGGISIKPNSAEALSNKLNTVSGKSGKSGKNSLDEIYGRILDKRYREYLAEQKQLREAEKPKYRNNADYVKGVSAENVKKAKAELGSVLDSFKDGKLPSQKNVSQGDLDRVGNVRAFGAAGYPYPDAAPAPENVQRTVKALGKGFMAEVNNVGALPISVINSLSGGKLAEKSDLVRVLLENRDQINKEFQEELAAIDSMPLRVIGSLGYAVPDILIFKGLGAVAGGVKGAELAAKGIQAANLGSKGGFLADAGNAAKALVSPKNAKMAAAYGGKYFDENLRSGMEPDEALRSAALQAAAAGVLNEAGYSPVGNAKGWIGDGTKGVVTDFMNRAARAVNDPDGSGDWLDSALEKENLGVNFLTGVLTGGVGRVGGSNNNSIPKVKSDTAKGTKRNLSVGNYKKIGGGTLSERALQEAWIEDLLRKYYWLP